MSNPSLTFEIPRGGFVAAEGRLEDLAENLILQLSDRASRRGLTRIRGEMRAQRLGRLGNALGQTSDLKKTGRAFRRGNRISASGVIFARSRSPRTLGALESYLAGASIAPRSGKYLWIPSDDLMRRARVPLPRTGGGRSSGNVRLTPGLWNRLGFDKSIGRLQFVRSRKGTPLMIVRNAPVNQATGRVARRTKTGRLRKNTVENEFFIAFVGITKTQRTRRLVPRTILEHAVAETRELVGA